MMASIGSGMAGRGEPGGSGAGCDGIDVDAMIGRRPCGSADRVGWYREMF